MTDPSNQDLKDLILNLDKKFEKRIDSLEKEMAVQFTELKGEVKCVEAKIDGVEKKLDARLDGLEKRLNNEELISRGVLGALLISVATGLVKLLFFSTEM